MTLNELEQIIKKLRYYGVDKEIEYVSSHLQSLTRQEIINILSMDYKIPTTSDIKGLSYTRIFENHMLLSSEKFKQILDLILVEYPKKYESMKQKAVSNYFYDCIKEKYSEVLSYDCFFDILSSRQVWKSKYLLVDIETIYNKLCEILSMVSNLPNCEYNKLSENSLNEINLEVKKLRVMIRLSKNQTSLEKNTHMLAMTQIKDAKTIAKANAIFDIATSKNAKVVHNAYKYSNMIENAKTDNVVDYLNSLIFAENILDEEMEVIVNAESEEMSEILYKVVHKINYSDDFNDLSYSCLDDLKVIARTENIKVARELARLATSLESIKSHKHKEQMRTISALTDAEKAKSFVNVLLNKKDSFDELDVILYNAQRYVDDYECATELPASVFKINKKYNK